MLILKISKDLPETLRRFFFFSLSLPRLLPDLTVFMSNTDGTLWEAGTAYPSRATVFIPGFWWCPLCSSFLVFCFVFIVCLSSYCVLCTQCCQCLSSSSNYSFWFLLWYLQTLLMLSYIYLTYRCQLVWLHNRVLKTDPMPLTVPYSYTRTVYGP
jgi:hypothetical protein